MSVHVCEVWHGMCAEGCPVIVAWLFAFQHHLMATGSTHIGGPLAEIRGGGGGGGGGGASVYTLNPMCAVCTICVRK